MVSSIQAWWDEYKRFYEPAKVGYLRGDEPRLFQICANCDADQAEIERKVTAIVTEPAAIAAE
jgi:hypothetical protein